jgi:hypothetical protein
MFDLAALEQMKNIDISAVDPDTIVDASEINVDINLPIPERMADYARRAGNPYFVKAGKIIVKMCYSDTTASASDCFERYIKTS